MNLKLTNSLSRGRNIVYNKLCQQYYRYDTQIETSTAYRTKTVHNVLVGLNAEFQSVGEESNPPFKPETSKTDFYKT